MVGDHERAAVGAEGQVVELGARVRLRQARRGSRGVGGAQLRSEHPEGRLGVDGLVPRQSERAEVVELRVEVEREAVRRDRLDRGARLGALSRDLMPLPA